MLTTSVGAQLGVLLTRNLPMLDNTRPLDCGQHWYARCQTLGNLTEAADSDRKKQDINGLELPSTGDIRRGSTSGFVRKKGFRKVLTSAHMGSMLWPAGQLHGT